MVIQNNNLFELKRIVRECASSSSLNINCDDITECVYEEIDIDKFKQWLQYNENKIKSKTNQTSYFKKSFLNELKNGTFKPITKSNPKMSDYDILALVMPTIYTYMGKLWNCKDLGDSTFFIEEAQIYIVKHNVLSVEELNELNEKILDYIENTYKKSIPQDYCELLKKSNLLKGKVKWDDIAEDVDKSRREFEELMKYFEEKERERNADD